MIRFQCPCGKRLAVDEAHAGRMAECPDCGTKTRAPEAEPVLSGPEALAAALRGLNAPDPDEIPVAEEVALPPHAPPPEVAPPEPAPPVNGLDALAQVVKSVPAAKPVKTGTAVKPAGRVPVPANGRRTKDAADLAGPNAGQQAVAAQALHNPLLIGIVSAVTLLVILVIIAAFFGGEERPPPKPAEPAATSPRPARPVGRQPGELFGNVPFEERKDETPSNPRP